MADVEMLKLLREMIDNARHYTVKSSDPSVMNAKMDSTPPDSDLNSELLKVLENHEQILLN